MHLHVHINFTKPYCSDNFQHQMQYISLRDCCQPLQAVQCNRCQNASSCCQHFLRLTGFGHAYFGNVWIRWRVCPAVNNVDCSRQSSCSFCPVRLCSIVINVGAGLACSLVVVADECIVNNCISNLYLTMLSVSPFTFYTAVSRVEDFERKYTGKLLSRV